MESFNVGELVSLLSDAGIVGMLIFVLAGGQRGVYVWRREYEELKKDRDWWRETALRALDVGEEAVRRDR